MNRWICRAAVVLSVTLAACSGSSDTPLAPAAPRHSVQSLLGGVTNPGTRSTETPPTDSTIVDRSGPLVGGN